jgi:hypothetical protein
VPSERVVGDPWWTVLYRDPARFWWAPALVTFAGLLALRRVIGDEPWSVDLLLAGSFGALGLLLSGYRYWSRRHL